MVEYFINIHKTGVPVPNHQTHTHARKFKPAPVPLGEVDLPELRRGPVVLPDERQDQRVLPLLERLRARHPGAVEAEEVAVLLLGPDGEHLLPALLVEPHAPVPFVPTGLVEQRGRGR